jgi:hypothetical protein
MGIERASRQRLRTLLAGQLPRIRDPFIDQDETGPEAMKEFL